MILNKACLETELGSICYLWLNDAGETKIVFLGIGADSIFSFIKKLCSRKITIKKKKLPAFEDKLTAYFSGMLRHFGEKYIFLIGTEFEKKVWQKAAGVPFGWTLSYGELAAMCGKPGAARAVGNAMGKNPVMLLVPCHRIIKGDGSPGGFGSRPDLKKELLAIEGIRF